MIVDGTRKSFMIGTLGPFFFSDTTDDGVNVTGESALTVPNAQLKEIVPLRARVVALNTRMDGIEAGGGTPEQIAAYNQLVTEYDAIVARVVALEADRDRWFFGSG